MKYPDGSIYEGDFHEGKRHGTGKYTYPNGDTYEGEWHQGQKHGKGVFTFNKDNSTVCICFITFLLSSLLLSTSILVSGFLGRSKEVFGISKTEAIMLVSLRSRDRIKRVSLLWLTETQLPDSSKRKLKQLKFLFVLFPNSSLFHAFRLSISD